MSRKSFPLALLLPGVSNVYRAPEYNGIAQIRGDVHPRQRDERNARIRRFLDKKQRVKVSVFFRGREITHPEIGKDMLDKVYEKIQDVASLETSPRLEGRNMSILVVPR